MKNVKTILSFLILALFCNDTLAQKAPSHLRQKAPADYPWTTKYKKTVKGLFAKAIAGVPAVHTKTNVQGSPGIAPETQTVKVGETATFTLDAAIIGAYAPINSIQWYKNQQPITGATSATYTTPAATLQDNFSFYVPFVNGVAAGGYNGLITVAWLYVYPEGTKIVDWKEETAHADFSDRDSLEPLIFAGKMWFFCGWKGSSEMLGDVWNSLDGITWNIVLQQAPWGTSDHKGLDMHMTTVFAGRMFVMGGNNAERSSNEVWSSTDGVTWRFEGNAQWPARAAATLVVFNGKMIIMGGQAFDGKLLNDIWSSTDGITWKFEGNAAWNARVDLRALVFKGKVYMMAGLGSQFFHNDVWVAADGINFSKLPDAPWKPRHWVQPVVYRDHIFVFAGESYAPASQLNDCWYSPDGVTWKQLFSKKVFRQKHGHAAIVHNDMIYLIGGSDFRWGFPQVSNSVWSLQISPDFFGSGVDPPPPPINKYILTTNANKSPDLISYDAGTKVTLTPKIIAGSNFKDWSTGGTANPLTVTMDASKTVTANYSATVIDPPPNPQPQGTLTERMQIILGPLPPTGHDLKVDVIFEKDMGNYLLRKIKYLSDPNDGMKTNAFVTIPKKPGKKAAFVVAHQTTPVPIYNGARESVNYYDTAWLNKVKRDFNNDPRYPRIDTSMFFGVELAELGYVTICPDAAFFGEFWQAKGGEPFPYAYDAGYKSATMKNIQIHRQAVRILESMTADVDPNKIGMLGHSLGGFHTMMTAYYEPKIKVAIISPFANLKSSARKGGSIHGPDPGIGATGYRYMPLLRPYKADASDLPFDFEEILYALNDRKVFINEPIKDPLVDIPYVKGFIDIAKAKFPVGNFEVVYPEIHHTFAYEQRLQAYAFIQKHFGGTVITPPIVKFNLTVNIEGEGTITKTPNLTEYSSGTTVIIKATANSGSRFDGWQGASYTSNPITVWMNEDKAFIAKFSKIGVIDPPPPPIDTIPATGEFRFVTQPVKNHLLSAGQTATFFVVVAGGKLPYKYQWRKDGGSVVGATSPSYTTGVTGDYALNVTDNTGKAIRSNPVYVRGGTVITPPIDTLPVIDPPPVPVLPVADNQTINVDMTGTGKTFEIVSQAYVAGKSTIKFVTIDSLGKKSLPATITINIKGGAVTPPIDTIKPPPPPVDTTKPPVPGIAKIPVLDWEPRSDWISVEKFGARGNDTIDDTKAIQAMLNTINHGVTFYFPPGVFLQSEKVEPPNHTRWLGVSYIGHGAATIMKWIGPKSDLKTEMAMWYFRGGQPHSKIIGITFDGQGKAATGARHSYEKHYETELLYQHCSFSNFQSAGIKFYNDYNLATSEPTIDNCYFENNGAGIAISKWNNYDNTIKGCEFRNNRVGISAVYGTNIYSHNNHFEGSKDVDIIISGSHASSIRRTTSNGSNMFIRADGKLTAIPLTIQDCMIAGWKNPAGAIISDITPMTIFDVTFENSPTRAAIPIVILSNQRVITSNIKAPGSDKITNKQVIEVPAGIGGVVTSANQTFLKNVVRIPKKVFPCGNTTTTIKACIAAAKAHGNDAIAYLPTGKYNITEELLIDGKDYFFGGSGRNTLLAWAGPPGGNTLKIQNADNIVIDNISVGIAEGGKTNNAIDILQVGSGKPSFVKYNHAWVYGMYSNTSEVRGLVFKDLGKDERVLIDGVEGNIRFEDCSDATVLMDVSFEGSVTVSGKSLNRSGFIGGITRLGSVTNPALWIKDNHSLVFSDFYSESGTQVIRMEGNDTLPPGRVTIAGAKFEVLYSVTGNAVEVNNYKGDLILGPDFFYNERPIHKFFQQGTAPFDLTIWAGIFFGSKPEFSFDPAANISIVGSNIPDVEPAEALKKIAIALDNFRRLGQVDFLLNNVK